MPFVGASCTSSAMLALVLHGALAVSPGDPITTGCKSVSSNAQDAWCVKNCAAGNCPPTICECSGAPTPREQPEPPTAATPRASDQERDAIAQREADIAKRDAEINARDPAIAETMPANMGAPATAPILGTASAASAP